MSDELKYRLNQFEAVPPDDAWENISSSLDEWNELGPLATRLQNAAIEPPIGVWREIENRLDNPVIEITEHTRKIGFRIYRVAASVVIVTLLISGAWKLFAPSSADSVENGEKDLPVASIDKSSLLPSFPIDVQKSTKKEKINSFAKNEIAIRDIEPDNGDLPYKKIVHYAPIEGSKWLTKETPISVDAKPIENHELETIKKVVIGNGQINKYLVIAGPGGQTTRISVKFADLINYLAADPDNSIEDNINIENARWRKLFKEWREKIMHSGYTPTSGNFLDIAEFTEFIRKNQ